MGADGFVAFYGIRFDFDDADALDEYELQWRAAARKAKLITWSGRLTDGEPYYLLVGTLLGDFGVEGSVHQKKLTDSEFTSVVASTTSKLRVAGIEGEPALYLLFEAQY